MNRKIPGATSSPTGANRLSSPETTVPRFIPCPVSLRLVQPDHRPLSGELPASGPGQDARPDLAGHGPRTAVDPASGPGAGDSAPVAGDARLFRPLDAPVQQAHAGRATHGGG